MSSLIWVEKSVTASEVGFATTMITNSFLIYLILNHTKKLFGAYKYLIVAFSTMGLIFATAEFIVKPMTHNFNASFTFFTVARPFHCSTKVAMVLLAVYSSTYAATISLLAVQFVYRYWAIFHSHRVSYFDGVRILIWISIPIMFGVDWAFSVYFFSMPDDFSKKAVISKNYDLNISQLAHFVAVVYDEENNIRWRSAMVMGSVSKILFIQYAVMVYCGTRMHFKMGEKLEKLSVKNRKMHQQLFKTLVVQITVPTFIIFMPVMIMFAIPFLDMKINVPTGPVICALSLYPFIDAIIVLCIVSDYRKASSDIFHSLIAGLSCNAMLFAQSQQYNISTSANIPPIDSSIGRSNQVSPKLRFSMSNI